MPYDLIIRDGLIYDGLIEQADHARQADIGIKDGVIHEIGTITETAPEEIQADGAIVTPGFVDVHTHYDGQVTWSSQLAPSSLHGVTTAVMGNCGVGFAPCHKADHDRLIKLMEGVEDIPFPVLSEGLPWNWHSFGDYLDSLEQGQYDIDFAAQLPHAALRVYVMGERGANREAATPEDCTRMAELAEQAVNAGAIGFSTSRTLNHRTADGDPTPTLTASEGELTAIAMGLKKAGKGVLQFVSDFTDPEAEFAMLRRIVETSGRPLSVTVAQADIAPEAYKYLLAQLEQAQADGLEMRGQVCGRPVGLVLGLELTLNPFSAHPSYLEIAHLPLAERRAQLRDPAFQNRLLNEAPDSENPFVVNILRNFGKMFIIEDIPDYEPVPEAALAAQARQRGMTAEELALEWILRDDGRGMLYLPFLNYAYHDLSASYEMLQSPATIPGLSDGGAHVGMICDGSFPTSMLTHWTRDRTRGPKFDLAWTIKRQTHDTARALGLYDRGVIAVGYRADINIIDYDHLTLHKPQVQYDLPAGGKRLMQFATGYLATIVKGEIIIRNGTPTGKLPGRLIRGSQPVPQPVPHRQAAE